MTIKEWQVEVRRVNAEHGWESKVTEDNPGMFSEKMLLVISEISEALEEFRDHRPIAAMYFHTNEDGTLKRDSNGHFKPEGIPIEIADAVIRILDFCEANGIDLEEAIYIKHEYNKTRPFKHGGKKI